MNILETLTIVHIAPLDRSAHVMLISVDCCCKAYAQPAVFQVIPNNRQSASAPARYTFDTRPACSTIFP